MPDVTTKKEQLEKIKGVFELVQESITRKEFVDSFKNVVDMVLKMEKKHRKLVEDSVEELKRTQKNVGSELSAENQEILAKAIAKVDKLIEEERAALNLVIDKARTLKSGEDGKDGTDGADGKDADEEAILDQIFEQLPDVEEETSPKKTRDKLETLKGKERLHVKAIDGLKEMFEEFKKDLPLGGKGGGGTSAAGVKFAMGRIVKSETPTGAINGSNKTYTVTQEIHAVFSFAINGEVIMDSEYSFSGRTITFTTALPAALDGLAFRIVYV